MDISNLIIQLQAKVNDLTYNQVAVAKSIELLKTGQVNYINEVASLPTASTANGYMYYVRGLGIYYSNGTTWISIKLPYPTVLVEGFAWSWGSNPQGQLGDNTAVSKSSPVSVVGGFTDWCSISNGYRNSVASRINGTAWSWGYGLYGALGDNTNVTKSSPVSVVGGFTNWCQVSAGRDLAMAVRTNGTAWGWGNNAQGQLGDCTTVTKSSPVSVVGGFTDWCQISAGCRHSVAVRTNGSAWAWGCGQHGRLGNNNTTDRSSPVSVVGGFTDWCQISAGDNFSIAVRTNGTAWSWGYNALGNLGDCTTVSKSSPVSVVGGFTDWCQVSTGQLHSIAVRTNGTTWAWGYGACGRLGDNTATARSSPVSVVGGFTDWCQVSAGATHSLAVRTNGTAWGWGNGTNGRLGENSATIRSSPVSVVGGFTNWCKVAAGVSSIALRVNIDS